MKSLFTATNEEREVIRRIAVRAIAIMDKYVPDHEVEDMDIIMDLEACHSNGCPLRLAEMEQADDFNLMHDIGGIGNNLNRKTGKLHEGFLPRFACDQSEGVSHA